MDRQIWRCLLTKFLCRQNFRRQLTVEDEKPIQMIIASSTTTHILFSLSLTIVCVCVHHHSMLLFVSNTQLVSCRSAVLLCCSESGLLNRHANGLGNSSSVFGVNLVEVWKDTLLDVASALTESSSDVLDDLGSHLVVEDLAEELTRLLIVGIWVCEGIATGFTDESLCFPGVSTILDRCAGDRVWLVVRLGSVSTIDGHETIPGVVVAHASAVWAVNWDLVVVWSQSVSVSVRVVDKTTLKHLAV